MNCNQNLLILAAVLLASGCGGSANDPPAEQGQAATAVECKDLPPHVALPADAVVSLCTQAETDPGHMSGTVLLTTGEKPDALIAFYKAKAKADGIPDSIANNNPEPGMGPMYSARDGTRRSFMAITKPVDGGRTEVTLNWGMDK